MTFPDKRLALRARIENLALHASALEVTFKGDELKAQATDLLTTLERAKASLDGHPSASELEAVEHAVDAASLMLGSIGRLK
jgi:hypothetical protein